MHIVLLTQVTGEQLARIEEIVAARPEAIVSRDRAAARTADLPITAILGGPSPELIEHLHHLEWVQFRTDSLEAWRPTLGILAKRQVRVTRTRGSYNQTVPDQALLLLLALARDLPNLLVRRARREWSFDGLKPTVLSGATVGILGMGSIGREVAERCLTFGLRVVGVDPDPLPAPAGVDRIVGPERLHDVLGECDFVVVTVPLTPATEGLIDADALAAMKPTAHLINIARGGVVDTADLLAALDEGRLAGAALDVVEPSPLPEEHPLWAHPRVILTCHSGQAGSHAAEAQFEIICENVRRYVRGEPLTCQIDPADWI